MAERTKRSRGVNVAMSLGGDEGELSREERIEQERQKKADMMRAEKERKARYLKEREGRGESKCSCCLLLFCPSPKDPKVGGRSWKGSNSLSSFPETSHLHSTHPSTPSRSTTSGADCQVEGVRSLVGDSEQPVRGAFKPVRGSPPVGGGETARGGD